MDIDDSMSDGDMLLDTDDSGLHDWTTVKLEEQVFPDEMLLDLCNNTDYSGGSMCNISPENASCPARSALPPATRDAIPFSSISNAETHHVDDLARAPSSGHVVAKIERVFRQLADSLLNDRGQMTIVLSNPPRPQASMPDERQTRSQKTYHFPGRNAEEAWRFTIVLRILELMRKALASRAVVTKRDMYYSDPALFGSQAVVDRYVEIIATSFQVPRSQLNVCAAAKGLLAGAATIFTKDGSRLDLSAGPSAVLVMEVDQIVSIDIDRVCWILVIEKEATFQSIISSSFWDTYKSQGIIVTAKGYPDVATRALLHLMTTPSPRNSFRSPPSFGLVDFDPDGIGILSVYKHGSAAMRADNSRLVVPGLQRIGLRSDHISINTTHQIQGLLSLTARDRKKATAMLGSELMAVGGLELAWRTDLQIMLMLNYKAELQVLDVAADGLQRVLVQGLPLA